MIIQWNGHSCFTITSGDYSLVVDPYKGVTGHPDVDLTANDVYASHDHYDHNYFEGVKLIPYEGEKPVTVRTVPCFHDECRGAKRGNNLIHIFSLEGMTAVHLGDLGHLLSKEQAEAVGPCDVLMIPVGGYYTIDGNEAYEVCEQLMPRIVIPMHYRHGKYGFDVISGSDVFTDRFPADFIKKYEEPVITVTPETDSQLALFG
ncbi:MAG: MBL fold metallo-hydrolase [Clostridia bacterium]|nr:MBL fold metallo-hydrolase [Clostridia bacterium]